MWKLILSLVFCFTALLSLIWYSQKSVSHPHYHAGFLVYIDGIKQDFSDYKYMNFVACTEHNRRKSAAEEQIELAHLHDGVGDVVHVHREGAVWSDLFRNLNYELPQTQIVKAYSAGNEVPNFLTTPIFPNQSLIIVVGNSQNVDLDSPVSDAHILEVEKKSELCGTN